jgi:hypothetical protein
LLGAGTVRSLPNVAIAVALVDTVTFFIFVVEFCGGQGELTQAQLLLLGANIRMAHLAAPIINDNKRN